MTTAHRYDYRSKYGSISWRYPQLNSAPCMVRSHVTLFNLTPRALLSRIIARVELSKYDPTISLQVCVVLSPIVRAVIVSFHLHLTSFFKTVFRLTTTFNTLSLGQRHFSAALRNQDRSKRTLLHHHGTPHCDNRHLLGTHLQLI